jgi:TolB protein
MRCNAAHVWYKARMVRSTTFFHHWARRAGLAALALAVGLTATPARAQSGDAVNGGNITVMGQAKVIPVEVTADSPQLAALMQRAFSVHGAFQVVAGTGAEYTLHFAVTGATSVSASAQPHSGGAAFTTEGSGGTWREAAYRAADALVQKLTGLPGFFAGKIAFVSHRTGQPEIFVSDLLGQEMVQLTNDPAQCMTPRWSPDGSKILYTGYYRTGFPDIILVDVRARTRRTFAGYNGTNTGGTFSPDGRRVVMVLSFTGTPQLYVSDDEGRHLHALTKNSALKSSPCWSPDGSSIAFSSDPRGSPLLYQISASGGATHSISTYLAGYCAEPSWNPRDPNLIAFMAANGGGFQLGVYNFQTRTANWLTSEPGSGIEPCWTNDGRHIIYTHQEGSHQQLYIVDAISGRTAILTSRDASQVSFVYPAQ